ncbi:MAG: hypothetical protein KC502_21865 [Myxococcales bacterium]|nr:hypothetical protein [Myxococcales bacterium]
MSNWSDNVCEHGPLVALASNLWLVRGSLPRGDLTRNMTVYRLPEGRLVVHSAVALNEAGMASLDALGPVSFIIVPNGFHRLDAGRYKARYPDALVLAPKNVRKAAEKVVPVDGLCEAVLPPLGIQCIQPGGIKAVELAYELPIEGGVALVVADLLFNHQHMSGFGGWFLKTIGSTGFFGMTGIGRMLMLKDSALFKAWLREQAERADLQMICVAHGDTISGDCPDRLRAAADRL